MNETFSLSLLLMGQGMIGIFAVILIIYVVLLFLGKPKKRVEKSSVPSPLNSEVDSTRKE